MKETVCNLAGWFNGYRLRGQMAMWTLFYLVGSEENDAGQENPGTFTCKATPNSSGTSSKSEGCESDCSYRESHQESIYPSNLGIHFSSVSLSKILE